MHGQAIDIKSLLWLYRRLEEEGGNSDAKDGKRRSVYRARSGRPAVQTPCGGEIEGQKLGRCT